MASRLSSVVGVWQRGDKRSELSDRRPDESEIRALQLTSRIIQDHPVG